MRTDEDREPGSARESEPDLRRVLGGMDATCVVVGAIVGVGIFFTPSRVAQLAGSPGLALLAWALGGLIALAGALTFAELGGLYPRSGGQYHVLRDAFGPLPAFLFVFCNSTAIQAGAAAIIALVCAHHLAFAVLGSAPADARAPLVAAALIAGVVGANCMGVRWGSRIQNLTVYAKVATLLAVTLLATTAAPAGSAAGAVPAAPGARSSAASPPMALLFAALVPTLFSYGGWQQALWIAGEVRDARRNVPRAIVAGVVVVVALYLLVNWGYLRLLGVAAVAASRTLAADAVAAAIGWGGAARAVAGAVALSAFGVLNAQFLSGPRLVYALARDGRFFSPFARVSPRHATPSAAILLLGALALVLLFGAGAQGVDQLLTGVVFIDGVFFVLTGAALFVLRRRAPDADRPVRVPGYPLVPLVFVIGEAAVVLGAYGDPAVRGAAFIGAAWIAAGALTYVLFFRAARDRSA